MGSLTASFSTLKKKKLSWKCFYQVTAKATIHPVSTFRPAEHHAATPGTLSANVPNLARLSPALQVGARESSYVNVTEVR